VIGYYCALSDLFQEPLSEKKNNSSPSFLPSLKEDICSFFPCLKRPAFFPIRDILKDSKPLKKYFMEMMMTTFFQDLKIRHKMMLAGLALVVPIVALMLMLISEKDIAIDFAQKEIYGVNYLKPLNHLLKNLPKHRGMAAAYLNGDESFKGKISEQSKKINEGFTALDVIDQKHGEKLATSQKLAQIKEKWHVLEKETLDLSAKESFERHTALISEVIALISHVGDSSNLILDPDLDSFYLMDTVVVKLPALSENLAQLRGLVASVAARQEFTDEDHLQAVLLRGQVAHSLESLDYGLEVAFRENATLGPLLGTLLEDVLRDVKGFEKTLDEHVFSGEAIDIRPEVVFSSGTQPITSLFNLYGKTTPALENLLQQRMDGFSQNKYLSILSIFLCLVAAFVLSRKTLRAIDRPIQEIGSVVQSIIGGDLSVQLQSHSNDELGTLAKNFKLMIASLLSSNSGEALKMARITSMVENSPNNLMMVDTDLKLIYMNPASKKTLRKIEHLLPCTVDEIVGKCIDIFHKDPARVRGILANPNNLPYEGNIDLGDERLVLTASAIYDAKKERIGSMASWELVTKKRKLEESLQETAASVAHATEILASSGSEMSSTVKEISVNLQKANETTSKAVSMTHEMSEKISQLESAGAEIGTVMKVISSIAAQTNLLALNATIEAARAGDAGKGFAVVANEVKDLAKGTAKATEEIQGLVAAIQENTKEAVDSIGNITEIIRENDEITSSIAGAVEEQSVTTNEMSQNMEEASQGTEKIVQSIKEVFEL